MNVAGELVVLDHLEIMAANGFDFDVDHSAPAGRRLRLKTVPMSKSVTFGADDVYELISLLTTRPGVMCRPSRLRAMFASRACRKAVMIGTALDKTQMHQLVKQMSGLDQPCAHLVFSAACNRQQILTARCPKQGTARTGDPRCGTCAPSRRRANTEMIHQRTNTIHERGHSRHEQEPSPGSC